MYLTLNSEFRPFTYDELVKPLSDYTEAYNKVEEQYSTLAQQTEAWKNIATQENSPEAYAMYKRYSDELNAVVEDFSRGMTVQNRSKLAGLKSRYASEITPISIAYDAYQKANAYRDTIKGQDDSAIFNVDRYYSLDDFLNGQMADNSFISGKNLQATIANQMMMDSYNKYNELIAVGHSKRAAANIVSKGDWIDDDSILKNIYSSAGITSEEAASKIKTYVDRGIAQGISTFSVNADEALLNEEIARAKAYSGRGDSGKTNSDDFNIDEVLVTIYDMFGGSPTETVETTSTEELDSGTPYASTTTKTTTTTKDLTDDRKLAAARQNPDMRFAAELIKHGVSYDDVFTLYNKYKAINEHFSTIKSFEDYAISIMSQE